LTREGYSTIITDLTLDDTGRSATATIQDIPIGVWHLKVEASDTLGIVRYAGETDVNVLPGVTTTANLELLPATGVLEIHVTWGRVPDLQSGLVLYYTFDGNLTDASGNGNNGTSDNEQYINDRWGHSQSAYLFDSDDNFITVANSASINPAHQVTIAFWLRVDDIVSNYMDVLVKGGPVWGEFANREYGIYVKQHTSPYYYLELKSAGDSAGQHELNSDARQPGEWVYFTAVIDRIHHSMQFYSNGALVDSTDDSYSSFNVNSYPLMIGWSQESLPQHSPLNGAMDNLRIYNRALTPAEIQALYSLAG
jgi:hypothetical protein